MTQDDPFAIREKIPAVSWVGAQPGTTKIMLVSETPTRAQQRDFETGAPDTWDDGNPKMAVVTRVVLDGEERSLWAPETKKDGSMFMALAAAQQAAGQRIDAGGTLSVTYTGDEPVAGSATMRRRTFKAAYRPADPFAQAEPPAAQREAAVGTETQYQDEPPF